MDLEGLKTGAQAASENVAKFQEDIPGLLSGLKTNLTSIFAKDNPMMAQREEALQTFLNTPSSTRASLLPANQPMVEGSPLNFSPTQQNAIVEARRNAALVPLAGLNQSIVGQYGNLGDILQAAASTYQSQLDAAKTRASGALSLYDKGIQEAEMRRKAAEGSGMDFSSLIATLLGGQNQRPPLEAFDIPETGTEMGPIQVSTNPLEVFSQPIAQAPQPSFWDNLMGLLGATPKQGLEQPATSQPTLAGNLDFASLPGLRMNY